MFSQFFEKKHLKLNHTLKSIPQNGFLEHHTPKSSLRNISKINCKSSQKLKSPFNSRSKSPVSPTLSKNFPNTPKTPTLSQQKPKESPKISEQKFISKKTLTQCNKEESSLKNGDSSLNRLKNPQKERYSSIRNLAKNQTSNYLTNHTISRIQTLPDSNGFEYDSMTKFSSLQQKKPIKTEKKGNVSSKNTSEQHSKCESGSYSNFKELQNKDVTHRKPMINIYNRKKDHTYNYDSRNVYNKNERDLSNHSAKSSNSTNTQKKPVSKTQINNDKAANYTIHISKDKLKETEGVMANEKLLFHVKMNEYEKAIELIEKNKYNKFFNINCKGDNDWTPLHYASLNGNAKILNLLLANEVIIDSETSSKLTPLMIACQKGNEEIASNLIRAGSDINLRDLTGNTALHYGAMNGQKKIVELLLKKHSLNFSIKNTFNKMAKESTQSAEIIKIFESFEQSKKNKGNIHNVVIKSVKSDPFQNMFRKIGPSQKDNKDSMKKNPNENFSSTNTTATNNMTHNTISFLNNEEETSHCNEKTSSEKEKINLDSFIIHGLIGKGSFGEVYLVEKKDHESAFYAMKVLHKSKIMKNNLIKYALTERNVLSLTNHSFIVKLIYAFQTSDKLFLIMDFCPGGDLGHHLQKEKKFTEERVKIYVSEIILALEDLHKRDIIFRDLKPDNIVLDKEGHALLTDFGLSKEGVEDSFQGAKSFCGSVAYLAPEMLKRTGHGKAVDWYLLGVVMYEMFVGIPPYYANNKEELFMNIEKAPLKIPSYISADAASLLKSLLQRNPAKRLGSGKGDAEEIKCHPFFQNINWSDVENRKLKPPIPQIKIKINTSIGMDLLSANIPNLIDENDNHIAGWSFAMENH